MKYKYLPDGRKVVVVGAINNNQTIVREVFVTEGGNLIPGGENFVANKLFDEPVETWLAKEDRRIKESIESSKATLERYESEIKIKNYEILKLGMMISDTIKVHKNLNDTQCSELDLLFNFIAGNIGYVVFIRYGGISVPLPLSEVAGDYDISWGKKVFEGLKLLSIFGKSDGNILYKINNYSDGSGGLGDTIYPFTSESDAIDFIKSTAERMVLENGKLSEETEQTLRKLNIRLSDDCLRIHNDSKIKKIRHEIEAAEEKKKEFEEKLAQLTGELKSLESDDQ